MKVRTIRWTKVFVKILLEQMVQKWSAERNSQTYKHCNNLYTTAQKQEQCSVIVLRLWVNWLLRDFFFSLFASFLELKLQLPKGGDEGNGLGYKVKRWEGQEWFKAGSKDPDSTVQLLWKACGGPLETSFWAVTAVGCLLFP